MQYFSLIFTITLLFIAILLQVNGSPTPNCPLGWTPLNDHSDGKIFNLTKMNLQITFHIILKRFTFPIECVHIPYG